MTLKSVLVGLLCFGTLVAGAEPAGAHGLAGKRFFPSTLAVDDPFVADELSLPTVFHIKTQAKGDEPAARETEISGELSKRITPNLGLSLEGELAHLDPDGKPSQTGFGNLEVGLKYQFFKSDLHETILSLGLGWEVGGTGRKAVEAESFDRVKPALFFGKGFGDLPDALSLAKPLAVTGFVGANIPTRSRTKTVKIELNEDGELEAETEIERHPNTFQWGFVVEYSIPYLQSFVKDIGLPAPFSRMIPVVELSFENPLDRGQAGKSTGTVNPGIIWAGRFFQIGLEAVFPINERTGKNVGVRAMLHFFLDDLFPKSLGRPLFGN
jgi:hypothetical protein